MTDNGSVDPDFTVNNKYGVSTTNENAVNVQTLEKCFNEKMDREMINIVNTVEDRILNAMLTANSNIITSRIEITVGSINASIIKDGKRRIRACKTFDMRAQKQSESL